MLSLARLVRTLWVSSLMWAMVALSAAAQNTAQPQTGAQPAQEKPPEQQQPPEAAEPDKAVVEQVKPLYALVSEAMKSETAGASAWNVDPSGKQPPSATTAPSDPTLTTDFVGFPDNQVYVPFQLTLDSQAIPSPAVAVYVRAVAKARQAPGGSEASAAGQQATEQKQERSEDQAGEDAGETKFPFEDYYVATAKQLGPNEPSVLSGYALLPTGSYDLYVALRERAGDASKPFQAIVVKQALDVPDFLGGDLTTSSVLLAKNMEELPNEPTPQERHENPYTLGRARLSIAADGLFTQGDEVNLVLFVYNFGTDPNQKPDVTVEYQLFEKQGEAEKEFVKLEPQTYDASTVDQSADRLAVSLSFAVSDLKKDGDFRLVIKVTDNISGKSLTRDAPFKVAAS
ncbi:MAG: hypothetical protein GEV06_09900 [Luteitalea sp.]|nr:hypothetical protein [Luteitalea sp.]